MARWCFTLQVAAMLCGAVVAGQAPASILMQPRTPAGGDHRALLIGIGKYPNYPESERLRYAATDAEKVRSLVDMGWLGRFSAVRLLQEQEATAERIMAELAELARAPRGRVVIFFAGHGLQDARGTTFLMPWEAQPEDPGLTGLSASDFTAAVKRIQAEEMLLFVDACNSGGLAAFLGADLRGAEKIAHQVGLFAASADARSYEVPAAGGGVFTNALGYAVTGAADANKDQRTTAAELAAYVEERVYSLVSEAVMVPGLRQRPVRSTVFDGSVVVATPPPPPPVAGAPSPPSPPGWLRIPQFAGPVRFTLSGMNRNSDVEIVVTDRSDDTTYRVTLKARQTGVIERLAPGTYTMVAEAAGQELYRGTLIVPLGQGPAAVNIDTRSQTNHLSFEGGLRVQ